MAKREADSTTNYTLQAYNDKLNFYFTHNDGWCTWLAYAGLQADTWYYVACIYTPGSNPVVYVNGSSVNGYWDWGSAQTMDSTSESMMLGKCRAGNFLNGYLSQVRVSSVARSQSEVQANWNSGDGQRFVPDADTMALWIMDEGEDGTIADSSGINTLYANKFYEENLTTGEVTTYYYLGDRLIAMYDGTDLSYIHQDHLTGTSLVTDSSGDQVDTTMKYMPFGDCLESPPYPTDKLFTGQRLDSTGLYYYNARYYDPIIGRFISADTIVQDFTNPQFLNRYAYVLNNPLKYNDPSGREVPFYDKSGQEVAPPWYTGMTIRPKAPKPEMPCVSSTGSEPLSVQARWGVTTVITITVSDLRQFPTPVSELDEPVQIWFVADDSPIGRFMSKWLRGTEAFSARINLVVFSDELSIRKVLEYLPEELFHNYQRKRGVGGVSVIKENIYNMRYIYEDYRFGDHLGPLETEAISYRDFVNQQSVYPTSVIIRISSGLIR